MLTDLRLALRGLRRRPLYCLFVAATLALGIGANTAVFGVLDALLLAELPVPDAEELVRVVPRDLDGEDVGFSSPLYQRFAEAQRVFGDVYAAGMPTAMALDENGAHTTARAQVVSGEFFSLLGVAPSRGRFFTPDDDRGARPVAVVSHRFWTHRLGNDPNVLGRHLVVQGRSIEIVGVAPPGFFGDVVGDGVEIWMPLGLHENLREILDLGSDDAWVSFLHVVGRAGDRSRRSVAAGLSLAFSNLADDLATERQKGAPEIVRFDAVSAARGLSPVRERLRGPLAVLSAIVGLLMLSACLNLASLSVTRSMARTRELATRLALGASARQVFRLLAVEALVLAALGGLAGSFAGLWARAGLLAWLAPTVGAESMSFSLATDLRGLAHGFFLSLAAAAIFGGVPAWRAARVRIASSLRRGAGERARLRIGRGAVIAQVAASFSMLFLAGLFLGTLRHLETTDPGFATRGVVEVAIEVDEDDPERRLQAYRSIVHRLEGVAGVRRAGWSWMGLVDGGGATICCLLGEDSAPEGEEVRFNSVTAGYFVAVGTTLLGGRDFTDRDDLESVAIVDETLAHRLFADGDAVDRVVRLRSGESTESLRVVGVVADARYSRLREEAGGMLFLPVTAVPLRLGHLFVGLDPNGAASPSRIVEALRDVAPGAEITGFATVEAILDRQLARERLLARLAGVFALLALALTAIGLYGAIFYEVARRRGEIALRMALGARREQVLGLVGKESLGLVGAGTGIGLVLSLLGGRLVESLLYGTEPSSPATLLATVAVLATVAALASMVPAARALAVEPRSVLGAES